jgi:hypothetical protein
VSASEILAEISNLSRQELCDIAVKIDRTLREKQAIVYDDAYGVFTEADQTALAGGAWDHLDGGHGATSSRLGLAGRSRPRREGSARSCHQR